MGIIVGTVFDQFNPIVDKALVGAFTRLPDDEVDGGCAEKELVRWAVDGLTAKVLATQRERLVAMAMAVGIGELHGFDFDTVCGDAILDPFIAPQCTE